MYSASSFRVSSPLIWLLLWKLQQCSHLLMANVPVLDAILAARARELPHLPQHVWLGSWVPGDTDGGPTSVAEPPTFCSADFRVWKLTFGWKLVAQEWKVQTDHSISGWNRVFNLNSSTVFVGWQSHLLSIDSQFLLVHLLILGGSPHFLWFLTAAQVAEGSCTCGARILSGGCWYLTNDLKPRWCQVLIPPRQTSYLYLKNLRICTPKWIDPILNQGFVCSVLSEREKDYVDSKGNTNIGVCVGFSLWPWRIGINSPAQSHICLQSILW